MGLSTKLWEETELPLRLQDDDFASDYYYQQLINEYYEQESSKL